MRKVQLSLIRIRKMLSRNCCVCVCKGPENVASPVGILNKKRLQFPKTNAAEGASPIGRSLERSGAGVVSSARHFGRSDHPVCSDFVLASILLCEGECCPR